MCPAHRKCSTSAVLGSRLARVHSNLNGFRGCTAASRASQPHSAQTRPLRLQQQTHPPCRASRLQTGQRPGRSPPPRCPPPRCLTGWRCRWRCGRAAAGRSPPPRRLNHRSQPGAWLHEVDTGGVGGVGLVSQNSLHSLDRGSIWPSSTRTDAQHMLLPSSSLGAAARLGCLRRFLPQPPACWRMARPAACLGWGGEQRQRRAPVVCTVHSIRRA